MSLRLPALCGALICAAALAACGGSTSSGSFSAVPSPTPTSLAPVYDVALGDDATVGIGTAACGTALPSTACPSDPLSKTGSPKTTASGVAINGYAQLFATQLAALHPAFPVTFVPLGVSGALAGDEPSPRPTRNDILANADQGAALPGVVSTAHANGNRVLVSLFAGPNDVADAVYTQLCASAPAGAGTQPAYCATTQGTTLADASGNARGGSLYHGYFALCAAIKSAAPDAVVVYGVPDLSKFPAYGGALASAQPLFVSGSSAANLALQDALTDAGLKAAYVDLSSTGAASLYTAANFAADGFHFSDAGSAVIEGLAFQQFTATYPGF